MRPRRPHKAIGGQPDLVEPSGQKCHGHQRPTTQRSRPGRPHRGPPLRCGLRIRISFAGDTSSSSLRKDAVQFVNRALDCLWCHFRGHYRRDSSGPQGVSVPQDHLGDKWVSPVSRDLEPVDVLPANPTRRKQVHHTDLWRVDVYSPVPAPPGERNP